jgi:hypothetical protein
LRSGLFRSLFGWLSVYSYVIDQQPLFDLFLLLVLDQERDFFEFIQGISRAMDDDVLEDIRDMVVKRFTVGILALRKMGF